MKAWSAMIGSFAIVGVSVTTWYWYSTSADNERTKYVLSIQWTNRSGFVCCSLIVGPVKFNFGFQKEQE